MCVEGTDWLDDWRENSMKTMRIEMETTENMMNDNCEWRLARYWVQNEDNSCVKQKQNGTHAQSKPRV